MKLNWNFQRGAGDGGGGGGLRKKSLPWGRYGYFLDLHIVSTKAYQSYLEKHSCWVTIAKRASDNITQTRLRQTNWNDGLRSNTGVPKTLVKQKLCLHSLYFPKNMLMLTVSRREFSDLHSIFRLCAPRYWTVLKLFIVKYKWNQIKALLSKQSLKILGEQIKLL